MKRKYLLILRKLAVSFIFKLYINSSYFTKEHNNFEAMSEYLRFQLIHVTLKLFYLLTDSTAIEDESSFYVCEFTRKSIHLAIETSFKEF